MGSVIKTKIRNIGTSAGVIIPQDKLQEAGVNIGDDIEIAILPNKKDFSGFGMARNAKFPFKRDKKVREFK